MLLDELEHSNSKDYEQNLRRNSKDSHENSHLLDLGQERRKMFQWNTC